MTYVIGRTVSEARAVIRDVGFYNCRTVGSAASCDGIGGDYVSVCFVGEWFKRRDIRDMLKRFEQTQKAYPVEFYRGLGHGSTRHSLRQIKSRLNSLDAALRDAGIDETVSRIGGNQ